MKKITVLLVALVLVAALFASCASTGSAPAASAAPAASMAPKASVAPSVAPAATPAPTPTPVPAPELKFSGAEMVIEAESIALNGGAKAVDSPDASGKKAAEVNVNGASLSAIIAMEPGKYVLTAYVSAPPVTVKGFYLEIGEDMDRCYPEDPNGKFQAAANAVAFEVKAAAKLPLKLEFNVPGNSGAGSMFVDKLVITKAK